LDGNEDETLAGTIGSSLLDGALGQGVDIGLGSILASAGLDPSGMGAVGAKLDAIIAELAEIETQIQTLTQDLSVQLSQLKYDVAIKPIQDLIDTNTTLKTYFSELTKPGADVAGLKRDIAKLMDADFLKGMATWNDALCGLEGQTAVLNAWGQAVAAKGMPFYTDDEAQKIDEHWGYLDAQQAMTVNFLIEHYNANKEAHDDSIVSDTLRAWQQNRVTQMKMLRGGRRPSDSFVTLGDDGKPVTVVTPLVCRPWFASLWLGPAGWYMWCSNIVPWGPLQPTLKSDPYYCGVPGPNDKRLPNIVSETGLTGWQLVEEDLAVTLINSCLPGSITDDNDQPGPALQARRFQVPVGNDFRIWTINKDQDKFTIYNGSEAWFFTAFTDGHDWEHPVDNYDEFGAYLLYRMVSDAELDQWFVRS
jgi:hypothetical protein